MATTNDIKNGAVLNLDGQLWSVIEFQHVKPGKGGAFVRTKLRNARSQKVVDKTFNAGTKVEFATVDRRDYQFLYNDGTDFVFMDNDTYEQLPIPADIVGDSSRFLLENGTATISMHEGEALQVELPTSVDPRDHLHRAGPPGRPLERRHEGRDRRDRCRDPGAAVRRAGHARQGRHARRQLPGPRQLTWARRRTPPDGRRASTPSRCSTPRRRATRHPRPCCRDTADRLAWATHGWFPFAREIVAGVADEVEGIDELIASSSANWPIDRMPRTDLAILRVGVWEIEHETAPVSVIVSEAVHLANELSTERSGTFINGVLGKIAASRG